MASVKDTIKYIMSYKEALPELITKLDDMLVSRGLRSNRKEREQFAKQIIAEILNKEKHEPKP